jgi:hypothetical protein
MGDRVPGLRQAPQAIHPRVGGESCCEVNLNPVRPLPDREASDRIASVESGEMTVDCFRFLYNRASFAPALAFSEDAQRMSG